MNKYWCTGKNTRIESSFPCYVPNQTFTLEYNSAINMYRLNNTEGIPLELMGYSPHKKALVAKLKRWVKHND